MNVKQALVIIIITLLARQTQAQSGRAMNSGVLVDQREVQRPDQYKPASERYIGWGKMIPIRQVGNMPCKALNDLESQIQAGHAYRDPNLVTWAHEVTHGINSRARMSLGANYNAFYCLNTSVAIFRTPRFRKSQIAQFIPAEVQQTKTFKLYVTGQRAWDDDPTYIFDEWVAHINAVIAYKELRKSGQVNMPESEGQHEATNAILLTIFSNAVLQATLAYDPQFVDLDVMADFVGYNIQRTVDAAGPLRPDHMGSALEMFAVRDIDVSWREPHDWIFDVKQKRWDRKTGGEENGYISIEQFAK
jgi:hypothetical protein